MTTRAVPRREAEGAAALVPLLRQLARTGAWVAIGSSSQIIVLRQTDTGTSEIGRHAGQVLQLALSQGLVVAEAGGERWRIAALGRRYLRRALSGGGSPARPAPASDNTNPAAARATRIDCESPLEWLHRRRDKHGKPLISEPQFNAGERLRQDFWFAQMTPRITSSWSGVTADRSSRRSAPGAGVELSDGVIAAAERVRRALADVGPELAGILIDICCQLKGLEATERNSGWPQRSAKIVLDIALTRLARHYGYLPRADLGTGTPRTRHWGASDYRPTIEQWKS